MKRILAVLLLVCLCVSLFSGCANNEDATPETLTAEQVAASQEDIAALEKLYEGKEPAYGDTHGHSKSSEWSDGDVLLEAWKDQMARLEMDFATIVDHRQTLHMDHEQWDEAFFIGGSEPGLEVLNTEVKMYSSIDYSMIFTEKAGIEAVLAEFQDDYDYGFEPGRFKTKFQGDHEKIGKLIQCIKDNGGMFVYVHPFLDNAYYDPTDRMNHWFADETGFEVFNQIAESHHPMYNDQAYECWVELLNAGKRLWATRGSDCHSSLPVPETLNTLYTTEKKATTCFEQLKVGNFTAGPVGIRIAVGDTVTGSTGSFEGKRVVVAVGDFHSQVVNPQNTYRVDIYDDKGLVYSQEISTTEMNYFAFDAKADAKYYRANVVSVNTNTATGLVTEKLMATGNPVFNG